MINVKGTLSSKKHHGKKLFVETKKVTIQANESDVVRSVLFSKTIDAGMLLDLAAEKFMLSRGLPRRTTYHMDDGTWIDSENHVIRRMTDDEMKFMWSIVDAKLALNKK